MAKKGSYESYEDEVNRRFIVALKAAVSDSAMAILEEGTRLIQEGPATGRIYIRGGVAHQASAPGEAPASDTGRLAQSGKAGNIKVSKTTISSEVNWSTKYAKFLEFGTVKMAPRPFARPAMENKQQEMKANFESIKRR